MTREWFYLDRAVVTMAFAYVMGAAAIYGVSGVEAASEFIAVGAALFATVALLFAVMSGVKTGSGLYEWWKGRKQPSEVDGDTA